MKKNLLKEYRKKRDFQKTKEPKGIERKPRKQPIFVIHKHAARHLHYDLRLESQGVLKSWAVPKGAPKKFGEKHLAVHVEDHPLEYAKFKGTIPEGEYGAGKVEIWDKGTYINIKHAPLETCIRKGVVSVKFNGKKIKGTYALVHFREKNWLWFKTKER